MDILTRLSETTAQACNCREQSLGLCTGLMWTESPKSDFLFILYEDMITRGSAADVVRSYLGYYAGSHQNSAAKRPWARIVLPWVTRWEVLVSYPTLLSAPFENCCFLSSTLTHYTPPLFHKHYNVPYRIHSQMLMLCIVSVLAAVSKAFHQMYPPRRWSNECLLKNTFAQGG